ncbi:MAG TPA: flavodoxin domain-containing protein [Conexibacter sp.]|nr:flavodoxin domain-containing protein [Conexibacter sp.]
MTQPILVAYATNHGHTRLIAERIGAVLREAGQQVELCDLGSDSSDARPVDYAGVVVAASVHAGHHQSKAVHWSRVHAAALNALPTAFLSVSLTAADDSDEARAATRELIDEVSDDSGWTPTVTLPVAGALQYREYDFPTRVLMRLIAHRHHQPTDVSSDVDYTDWAAVERFATDFAARVGTAAADGPPIRS